MLVLTGQSMAVARGGSAATGQMVICTGEGTATVYTDAQGRPTSAPHFCPDCIVMAGAAPLVPVLLPDGRLLPAGASLARQGHPGVSMDHIGFLSRAPPLPG